MLLRGTMRSSSTSKARRKSCSWLTASGISSRTCARKETLRILYASAGDAGHGPKPNAADLAIALLAPTFTKPASLLAVGLDKGFRICFSPSGDGKHIVSGGRGK